MSLALPAVRVGEPLRHESLSVFPLFSEPVDEVDYLLSSTALADESLNVEEVDANGSVPDLLVENTGDTRVLFLEGEELIGAKQNRVLNTSVLVAAHSKIKIPVSCVERGRWRYKSKKLHSSGSHTPSKLRKALKASVSRSIKRQQGHGSDQSTVWQEVDSLQMSHGVCSETSAMSDVFDSCQDSITTYREKLRYVDNATGMAVAVGDKILSIDLFDKPSTCGQVWDRMLSGVVFDAIEAGKTESFATRADVEQLIEATDKLPWESAKAVGEGEEYRAESESGDHASALAMELTVVHGSVIAG